MLLKHLIENPKGADMFMENPEKILERFNVVDVDETILSRLKQVSMASLGSIMSSVDKGCHGQHSNTKEHSDHSEYCSSFDPRLMVINPRDYRIIDLIQRLVIDESALKSFQMNPADLFVEYGITPNQTLADKINQSLNGNQQINLVTTKENELRK